MFLMGISLCVAIALQLQASDKVIHRRDSTFTARKELLQTILLALPAVVVDIIIRFDYEEPKVPMPPGVLPSLYLISLIPRKLSLCQHLFMIPPYFTDVSELQALYRYNPY
jgi:hypothetical protein